MDGASIEANAGLTDHSMRDAVERHVDEGGDTAGCGGAGRGGEAFPLGAAGVVHVHMRVDHARQQHLVVGQLDDPSPGDVGVVRVDRDDAALDQGDGYGDLGTTDDGPVRPEDDVSRHQLPR